MPEGTVADPTASDSRSDAGDPILDRLPEPVSQTLTGEQKRAIAGILPDRAAETPPVNIRLSLPFLKWRFYFTLVAGRERRSPARIIADRRRHPVRTASNIMFILGGAMVVYMLTLGGFLIYASVLSP